MSHALPSSHQACLVCSDHPLFPTPEYVQTEPGRLSASVTMPSVLQSYDNVLHGGIVSTLLDAAMTRCLFGCGITAMTAELKVRYLKPVPVESELKISAELLSQKRGISQLKATIISAGEVCARAEAKFMQV